jgi:hypothetical protein
LVLDREGLDAGAIMTVPLAAARGVGMIRIRTQRALIAATLVASVQLMSVAAPAAAASVTCTYSASQHKVTATLTGNGYYPLGRDTMSRIKVGTIWCGNAATVYNTDHIYVFAGDGDQAVSLDVKANGGFQHGFTDERGSSDEVEISINLGGGDNDVVSIIGQGADDHFVAGRSSGGFGLLGRVNVNANESTGLDADITLVIGVEYLTLYGNGGADTLSGAGGFGTGESYIAKMSINGVGGADILTGGAAADWLIGGDGPDVLKGGPGPDNLNSQDGAGGDQVFGGGGNDTCTVDPGDQTTSC